MTRGFITGIIAGLVVVTLVILTISLFSSKNELQVLNTPVSTPTIISTPTIVPIPIDAPVITPIPIDDPVATPIMIEGPTAIDSKAIEPVLPPVNSLPQSDSVKHPSSTQDVLIENEPPPTLPSRMTPEFIESPPSIITEGRRPESNNHLFNPDINSVRLVSNHPVSTFPIDVEPASWNFLRQMILAGDLPPPDAIRIEEMINYFTYGYTAPERDAKHPFATTVTTFNAPWNDHKKLVRIGIQGIHPSREQRPPLDLVFLVDISGSMDNQDRLGLLKQSLLLLLPELRSNDRIGIVTYAGSATTILDLTPASSRNKIISAIGKLQTSGTTAGAEGLQTAYDLLASSSASGRIGRVLLATDGGFNVGTTSNEDLESFIEKHREKGTYLSVVGFGPGNPDDSLMQTMARIGNGNAAHINTLSEARKALVNEITGALWPIADDVKIEVEFNPANVREYRLLGYESRSLNRESFNNKEDTREINAGHQVTAIYEITLASPDAGEISNLRYKPDNQATTTTESLDHELGFVKLLYKNPGAPQSTLLGTPVMRTDVPPDHDALFAAAIAGFGELMKNSEYLGTWSYADAASLAIESRGPDPFGIRNEATDIIKLMDSLK